MNMTPAGTAAWAAPPMRVVAISIFLALSAVAVAINPASPLQRLVLAAASAPAASAAATDDDTNVAAAPPFYLHAASPSEADRAVRCLTDAIYYEAANEPEEGQRAVAQVVVNRVRDPHFPKSVCGVVYQGWQRSTGCQFSFVCDGSIRRRHADQALWNRLKPIARDALNGYVVPEVGSATHYYARYVRPNWVGTVSQITQIGAHVFCSWKGHAGFVSALTANYAGGEFGISDAVLDGDASKPAPPVTVARRRLRRVTGRLRVAARDHADSRA
jgi:spore germination cell wall hydrolase CwlJ-like protein